MGLRNWGLDKVTGYVGRKTEGYKTKAGGVGLFLLGIVGIMGHIWPDVGLPVQEWDIIVGEFAGGLAAFGIGAKVEKVKNAVKENTEITRGKSAGGDRVPDILPQQKWDGRIKGQFP